MSSDRWWTAARPRRPCAAHRVDETMTKGRWIVTGIVIAVVGFATVQGLRPKPPPPVEVTTSAAKKGAVTRTVTAAGHMQARETVKVSSNVTADLLSLSVKEGDKVVRGQVLGQLETALYNLSRATLTAPIDGTILELSHKVGERIRGSDFSEDVVLLMGGLADMEVKAEVGEHEVVAIHVGDEAAVDIDAIPDKQFKGNVVAVGKNAQIKNPGTDAEVTTFFVRVGLDVPPEGALPGMSSAVSISTATHDNVVMI